MLKYLEHKDNTLSNPLTPSTLTHPKERI